MKIKFVRFLLCETVIIIMKTNTTTSSIMMQALTVRQYAQLYANFIEKEYSCSWEQYLLTILLYEGLEHELRIARSFLKSYEISCQNDMKRAMLRRKRCVERRKERLSK